MPSARPLLRTALLARLAIGASLTLFACDGGKVGGSGPDGTGGAPTAGTGGASGEGGAKGTGSGGSTGAGGGSSTGGATGSPDAGGTGGAPRDGGVDTAGPGTGGRATGGANGAGGARDAGVDTGAQPPITIWIAGDSTVATGTAPCPIGWGGLFKPFFNNQVTVTNSAIAGRSVRTWLYFPELTMDATGECILPLDASGNPQIQTRWQAMLTGMKAGDYLFIQFGINDSDPTCDRHVGLDAFKASYGVMAQAAQARGAHPVFLTPVSSIACSSANVPVATRGGYVPATMQAGTQFGVPVIDLNKLSVALYTQRGFCPIPGGDVSATTTGPVGDFFCDDHTHFSAMGAPDIATLVANAVRTQLPALAVYMK
jgi:lysophospholipase L1-like esterase